MENRSFYRLSLGVDLGGKFTGVFALGQQTIDSIEGAFIDAYTIVMPDSGDKLTYSMVNRTAVRHRLRGKKRFNMARRLALLIVEEELKKQGIVLEPREHKRMVEALFGLLKRRGYTRTESETDLTVVETVENEVFASHPVLQKYFNACSPIIEQYENLTGNLSALAGFYHDDSLPSVKEFKDYLKKEQADVDRELHGKAYQTILDDAKNICGLKALGHKHRAEYLEAIYRDIQKDSRLRGLVNLFGGIDRFHALIGNISNLQLRAQRWYFNAPEMLKGDRWVPVQLKNTLVRAFKYFHPETADLEKHRELIKELSDAKDIVEALCTINPLRTIPPYEDQNNRRPPEDLTLWLSPEKLDEKFGADWKKWARSLTGPQPELLDDLDEIILLTDRKSRIAVRSQSVRERDDYILTYVLQRVFDRSKMLDPYSLRLLARGGESNVAVASRENLASAIGSQHVEAFIECARLYYMDIENAHRGTWMPANSQVLQRSDIHPPMKKKILDILVGNVLGIGREKGQRFIDEIWRFKYQGNISIASTCARIERVRKEYGGEFRMNYRRAIEAGKEKSSLSKSYKELWLLKQTIDKVVTVIGAKLGLSDEACKYFANPYSLSQLYTLIETERNGFTSTTLAAHLENAWRMKQVEKDGRTCANCSRLPADSVRPFDGLVRRVLDREAWEIAKRVIKTIEQQADIRNGVVEIPIFVEDNSFNFTASVAELKKNTAALKKINKAIERREARLLSKEDRIKASARNICAYTGEPLKNGGEIDHILPRSRTSKMRGVVYNAEPNLIYVSQKGNQKKGDRHYDLSDLSPVYLKAVFGLDSVEAVESKIEDTVAAMKKAGRMGFFDLMTDIEQDCVRHALFLPLGSPARDVVMELLESQRRTRVNGTQSYFIRAAIKKIADGLHAWCRQTGNELRFVATTIPVQSELRNNLGSKRSEFLKIGIQSVASHAVDALCVLSAGLDEVLEVNRQQDTFDIRNVDLLTDLFPLEVDVLRPVRKNMSSKDDISAVPIFKEGIYREKFFPIFIRDKSIHIGYRNLSQDNAASFVTVTGKDAEAFVKAIKDCLNKPYAGLDVDAEYQINRPKAFELLTKVALTKCTLEEVTAAGVLEVLAYYSTRKSVKSKLLPANSKKLVKPEISEKDFSVSVNFALNKQCKVKGKVILPVAGEWHRLLENPLLNVHYGEEITESELDRILAEIWKRKENRTIEHARVRREFSLPLIDKPSGGFRIKRNSLCGETLYQVYAINTKYVGFSATDGIVDWKEPRVHSLLRHKRLIDLEGRYDDSAEIIPMDQFRKVHDGEVNIWMAPGSESRRYIRVEMSFENFKDWLSASMDGELSVQTGLELRHSVKLKKPKEFNAAVPSNIQALIGKPRSELFMQRVGQRVCYQYIVESSNTAMNEAFNQAIADETPDNS